MLSLLHIVIAIALSLAITLQQRAVGLSATFGGSGGSYVQRRGAEALLFRAAMYLSIAFFALGIARMFLE